MRWLAFLVACAFLTTACTGSSSSEPSGEALTPFVSGTYGAEPTLRFGSDQPPSQRQRKVLHQGTGSVVSLGDLVVVDYVGQFWDGEVFDNSYSKNQPSSFAVSEDSFFPGFSDLIVGVRAGSRVALVIPPPPDATPDVGTFVFVIDVVRTYPKTATGDTQAVRQQRPDTGLVISETLGTPPIIKIPDGIEEPETSDTVLLARGHGAPVRKGLLVVQYTLVDWTGKEVDSTWQEGTPTTVIVGNDERLDFVDSLEGLRIGSRVLIVSPSPPQDDSNEKTAAIAAVVDIVDQPPKAFRSPQTKGKS